jgi:hypothetical protein
MELGHTLAAPEPKTKGLAATALTATGHIVAPKRSLICGLVVGSSGSALANFGSTRLKRAVRRIDAMLQTIVSARVKLAIRAVPLVAVQQAWRDDGSSRKLT